MSVTKLDRAIYDALGWIEGASKMLEDVFRQQFNEPSSSSKHGMEVLTALRKAHDESLEERYKHE
jgi:hypothetical protein